MILLSPVYKRLLCMRKHVFPATDLQLVAAFITDAIEFYLL